MVVDLGQVTSVDPTGLGVLAGAARHLRSRGGGLAVTNASPGVVTSMRINGAADLLEVPASPALRVVPGAGRGGARPRARGLAVVPDGGLKQPS